MADQEGIRPVGCGYGLLGLCCVSCLRGPCRRSPFDDAAGGKSCRENSDWIVAQNLMERVALESLQAMVTYRDALERVSCLKRQSETAKLDAMKALLSPFEQGENALLDILSPKEAFPFFHFGEVPVGSWMTTLLGAMSGRPPARRETEAILTDALRLSAMALAAEALAQELTGSMFGEIDIALPDSPSPLLLLIADADDVQDDSRAVQETLISKIDGTCRKAAQVYRLPHVALLPAFVRRVYAKWGVPVSMTGSVAVVFSSSMIRGLGALALGFSLAPLPGHPIQGSPRVEKYLMQDMKSTFGHACLAISPREDPCEAIMRSLTA
jgi:hypothetical protein